MVERPEVTLHIGQVYASAQPTILTSIVGSGLVVCVFDPVTRVGGMNHFMVPARETDDEAESMSPGICAMDRLLGAVQKAGGDRRRLRSKLFGGARVSPGPGDAASVPERNVTFIEAFMHAESIVVISRDLGGYLPRRIRFQTDTGKTFVKPQGRHRLAQTRAEEREHLLALAEARSRAGDVTIFDA